MIQPFILRLLKRIYPLVRRIMPFQVYAYLALGAANTVLNIVLFTVLYLALAPAALAVELATAISFLLTVFTGFWLNKNFAFSGTGNERKLIQQQFGKYFLVSLQGQFSDYLITKGLILFIFMNPVAAYFISTGIMLTLNYFLQKYYTFRSR